MEVEFESYHTEAISLSFYKSDITGLKQTELMANY